jgi:acylphosphatase
MKIRTHVVIKGDVQGVFFRSRTRQEAKKRNVTGWVRNLPDGRVEAIFEGEETDVKELVDFCRKGPPGAKVASISVTVDSYAGEFGSFEIAY